MPQAAPVISAIASTAAVSQAHDARNSAKNDQKQAANAEKERTRKEQESKFAAKRQEYQNTRDSMRRGATRGRMSTILDKSDSLG